MKWDAIIPSSFSTFSLEAVRLNNTQEMTTLTSPPLGVNFIYQYTESMVNEGFKGSLNKEVFASLTALVMRLRITCSIL